MSVKEQCSQQPEEILDVKPKETTNQHQYEGLQAFISKIIVMKEAQSGMT